jgi:hypothetical protein
VPTADISIGTSPQTGDRQLQFTHITWDAGAGPFEIDPSYNSVTGIASFTQAIYKSPSRGVWRRAYSVPLAVNGIFEGSFDYRFPLTRFTLSKVNPGGSIGKVVATSPKTDNCITADTYVGGVPNTPGQTFIPPGNCADPRKPLGWSVGWGDEYDQTDNGQPIDLTGVPDGTYILRGIVDPEHVLTESNRTNNVVDTKLRISGTAVTVLAQTRPVVTPPSVRLTSPANGARVRGRVTLRALASAKSPARVVSVQFLLDGHRLGSADKSAPYQRVWSVGSTPRGTHRLSALVTDSSGNVSAAPVRTVTVVAGAAVNPAAPAARILSSAGVAAARSNMTIVEIRPGGTPGPAVAVANPARGQVVSGTVPVVADASDDGALTSVQFFLDGHPLGRPATAAPYVIRWNTATATPGVHRLTARAADAAGAVVASADVLVTVQNPPSPMTCFVMQAEESVHGRGAVTTAPFHTASAGETLLAFVSGGGPSAGRPGPAAGTAAAAGSPATGQDFTVSGGGLGWTLVARANAQPGAAEVWTATSRAVLPGVRITARPARPGYQEQLTVIAMEGTGGVGASAAASGAAGAPVLHLTTTRPTSLIFAVGDGGNAARTYPAGWVPLAPWPGSGGNGWSWSQYTNQPVAAAGTRAEVTTVSRDGGWWNLAAVEVTGDGG